MEFINYKIQLENFYGPLDLLLHLVRESELDPLRIPIAKVTDQYLTYLEMMHKLDINLAGEFLVMASTLMEIKSRTLVPIYADEDEAEEEADPKFELIRRLLEYKRYKDLSVKLRSLMEFQAKTFTRPRFGRTEELKNKITEEQTTKEEEPQVELDMWQIVKSFAKLSKEIVLDTPNFILYDDIPIERVIEGILQELEKKGEVSFRGLLSLSPDGAKDAATLRRYKLDMVRNFLATLELARRKSIEVVQESDFADIKIRIKAIPAEPPSQETQTETIPPANSPEELPQENTEHESHERRSDRETKVIG
ncbi:MAG TPA: segregation/condensation protein A [Planctomycetota bacterium]|nr:segregation/condensation protein A [Planctomycetota bacterium]